MVRFNHLKQQQHLPGGAKVLAEVLTHIRKEDILDEGDRGGGALNVAQDQLGFAHPDGIGVHDPRTEKELLSRVRVKDHSK